ncbi:unnamed protein product [Brassicogethes aeneus]|uniref:Uncharacterized protein n=1 Tax=Brassicogethes aeneus TaxID=1431903 RepID=A0A9P0AYE9_BRAAE|nr:unnamed protein product [Brassicogethes aeneus]
MIYDYIQNREDHPDDVTDVAPNYEQEFVNAKSFLQRTSTVTGDNMYDHLTDCLNKILAERPENVIDFFEEYSRKVKERRYYPLTDHLEDIYVPPGRFAFANKIMPFLKPLAPGEPSTVDPDDLEIADMSKNNMLQLLYYFEQTGVGLPRNDMFYLTLSMRKLIHSKPISKIRFWGVIYGIFKNYIILEAELKEEEYIKRNEKLLQDEILPPPPITDETALQKSGEEIEKALEELKHQQDIGGEDRTTKYPRQLPPEPPNLFEEPPEAPSEPSGVGINKKVYFCCNEIGDDWIELPDITPKHIRIARQIYKSFSGFLDREVLTYPEFPGLEKDYLRAQIARISAGTDISPLGFYTFSPGGEGEGEEEEEEEAEEGGDQQKTTYSENPKYDPPPLKDLLDMSVSFWVHHTLYILPQGRTSWWNPNPLPEQGEEMDEEMGEGEEEKEKPIGPEPETGPPLLTPCSEDATLEAVPAWSIRCSSKIAEEYAIAIVRSNLWPGGYTFTTQGKLWQNIYLGFGLKYLEHNFSPTPLPPVQQDYPIGPEIMEIMDPTGAQEEEWRIAHLPKPPPIKIMGGEELGEEEEDEDEDEDDDDDDE